MDNSLKSHSKAPLDGFMQDFTKSVSRENHPLMHLKDTMEAFFHRTGFLSSNESLIDYEDICPWSRAGGETYQSIGQIRYATTLSQEA
jgi:hypothetical protein